MMQNDRKLYPEQLHNHNGELIFARHPANKCLQEDVKAKKHMNMTPSQIHSSRSEYKVFDLKMFNRRINQEIRRVKFINYLEWKRTEKQRKFKEKEEKVQGMHYVLQGGNLVKNRMITNNEERCTVHTC